MGRGRRNRESRDLSRRDEPAYVPPIWLLVTFAALSANHGEPPGESVTPCGRFAMADMAL